MQVLEWTVKGSAALFQSRIRINSLIPFVFAVVNQEGQPLIEGKLKEKQVRWKFIKRWKTRYFTLAGNQLLFRKGKSVSVRISSAADQR